MKTSSGGLRAPKARKKLVMSYLDALLEWLLSSEFKNPSEFLAMSLYKVVLITEYGDLYHIDCFCLTFKKTGARGKGGG